SLAPKGTPAPEGDDLPDRLAAERFLHESALLPFLGEIAAERTHEADAIARHVEISLNAIIDRAQIQFAELFAQKEAGSAEAGLEGRLKQFEDRLDELTGRLERRREELERERECAIG